MQPNTTGCFMCQKKICKVFFYLFVALWSQTAFPAPSAGGPVLKAAPVPDAIFVPDLPDNASDRREQLDLNADLRKKGAVSGEAIPELNDDDLKNNPEMANHILNTAMIREDWVTLEHIMGFYRDIPGYDPVMYEFVGGALLRARGKHGRAIKIYRDIVRKQPDLSYVRLDLAGMLFENRAYRDAAKEFERVRREDIEPEAAEQAENYLQAISEANPWQVKAYTGWQYSNNVNNATSNDYFLWPFLVIDDETYYYKLPREAESMPHGGHGYSYGVQVQKDTNVKGNHNLSFDLEAGGVHYPHWQVDNEFNLSLDAGYKYQTLNNTFTLTPLVNASWLGNRLYSKSTGISIDGGRWITPAMQLSGSYFGMRKKYRDERYRGYDSTLNGISASALYAFDGNWFVFGGLGWQHEKTSDIEEISTRRTASLGTLYRFDNGTNIRLGGRYVLRRFKNPASLYGGDLRRDREIYADASIWREKWLPGGITPKLELSYLKVKSNIYAFPRNKKQVSLTFEKEF